MRIARTVALALATAVAAMALASAANATEAIQMHVEGIHEACDVAQQNCKFAVHSETPTELIGHAFFVEATESVCDVELHGYFNEDGSGHIIEQVLLSPDCTKQPCTVPGEDEWTFTTEEIGPNEYNMELYFCLENRDRTNPVHCAIDLHVNQTDHHNMELRAQDLSQDDNAQRCHAVSGTTADVEVEGHWVAEATESDEIENTHL